jgi:hypothetical protein
LIDGAALESDDEIEGSAGSAAAAATHSSKLYISNVIIADERRRFVHKEETLVQGIQIAIIRLQGTLDGTRSIVAIIMYRQ